MKTRNPSLLSVNSAIRPSSTNATCFSIYQPIPRKTILISDLCGKAFGYKSGLRVHRKTHTGVGAVYCDICNKVFGNACRMREHRVIHSGEKPFMCQLCGNRFSHRSGLRLHLKTLHKGGKIAKTEDTDGDGSTQETEQHSNTSYGEQQVIVSNASELHQQTANIQYVHHIQEVQQTTPTSIINAIQGIDPHTTAIQTLNPHDGTTTIQVIEAHHNEEVNSDGTATIQVPVSKMNHPEDITAVAEIVLQLHT
ncbi:uncharacterized protein [Amphiura filiformis]|uniref:uncharacterized protein isoform X2 n=1 Tax=Amphiura filiformis TaxID=82378 RepID=UPI003B2190E2